MNYTKEIKGIEINAFDIIQAFDIKDKESQHILLELLSGDPDWDLVKDILPSNKVPVQTIRRMYAEIDDLHDIDDNKASEKEEPKIIGRYPTESRTIS